MLSNILKSMFQIVFFIAIFIAIVWGFGILITQGIDKDIAYQCNKLSDQSRDYKEAGFWLTPSEKSMCDAIGITIDAPVKSK